MISPERPGDVGINVILCASGRIVGGTLAPGNGAPWISRAPAVSQFPCMIPCLGKSGIAVLEKILGEFRIGVQKKRQHVYFGIPEIMPFVSFSAEAFRGNVRVLIPGSALEQMVQIEEQASERIVISLDGDRGSIPEACEIRFLGSENALKIFSYAGVKQGLYGGFGIFIPERITKDCLFNDGEFLARLQADFAG